MTTTEQLGEDAPAWLDGQGDVAADAWHEGWTRGHAAGVVARPPATCLVAVPVGWRHARPGDTFRAPNGDLWHVEDVRPGRGGQLTVTARRGAAPYTVDVDPDERVHLLHEVAEADAITYAVQELGARLIERRTT